jgi:hypothetical protein
LTGVELTTNNTRKPAVLLSTVAAEPQSCAPYELGSANIGEMMYATIT